MDPFWGAQNVMIQEISGNRVVSLDPWAAYFKLVLVEFGSKGVTFFKFGYVKSHKISVRGSYNLALWGPLAHWSRSTDEEWFRPEV